MVKITLNLESNRISGLKSAELEQERILANNVIFPHDFNPHNVKLWVIGNEYGSLCAVWADCEQDALDIAVDAGLLDGLAIDEKDATEETARLGNAGEPFDLDYAWIQVAPIDKQDIKIQLKFAEARGAQEDNLDF